MAKIWKPKIWIQYGTGFATDVDPCDTISDLIRAAVEALHPDLDHVSRGRISLHPSDEAAHFRQGLQVTVLEEGVISIGDKEFENTDVKPFVVKVAGKLRF